MIGASQAGVVINELTYGTAFSLCSFLTVKHLFFRQAKNYRLFSVCSGAVLAAAVLIQLLVSDAPPNIYPTQVVFFILHAALGWTLAVSRNGDGFISLIFAQLFSLSVINSVQTAVFSLINGSDRSWAEVTALYCAVYLLSVGFVTLLKMLAKSGQTEPMSRLNMILLTGTMWITTTFVGRIFAMSDYAPDVAPAAAVPAVLILMAATALLLLSIRNAQAKHFRELSALSEQYMTAQARHFERAREADTQMRLLRHDMQNHIAVMSGLYESGRFAELGEYLGQISGSVSDVRSVVLTGNEIADAVISEKMSSAESRGVQIVSEGSLKGLDIPSVPLCTILADLLDNAIEAAEKVSGGSKRIELSAKRTGAFFYISIKNPSAGYVDTSGDIPTGKSDSTRHGLGLLSVRKAVGECGGTIELCCKEISGGYVFEAEVILPQSRADI